MQITEIYKSLQGESTYAGLPCVFVRLTGCNLRCTWCDSEYTFQGGAKMSLERGTGRSQRLSPPAAWSRSPAASRCCRSVKCSPDAALLEAGYKVLLETSGERPLERVPEEVVKIVDVKCPDSGEGDTFRM